MNIEEIRKEYVKIVEDIDKTMIESRMTIKQVEKEMEEIMLKARKNIHELSLLL